MKREARKERRSPRQRRRVKVTLAHGPSFTIDTSAGGFCVELLRVCQPGTAVSGTIHDAADDIRFDGVVVWARPGDPYLGLRGRMGVHVTRSAPARGRPASSH
jgi:hypothetical protein